MNGTSLTLGLVGALAASASLSRRGARASAPEMLYRGTRRHLIAGRQPTTSWTPCLPCAVIWSANPNTRSFEPDSTVHAGRLPEGTKVFDVASWGIILSLGDVLEKLGFTNADMPEADVEKLLVGLHKRALGLTKLGSEFKSGIHEEDGELIGEDDLPSEGLSLMDPDTTPRAFLRYFFWPEPTMATARRFVADSFAFADSPTVQRLLRERGYGAIRYTDVFAGSTRAAPKLLGVEAEEVPGIELENDLDWEEVPAHVTVRPLVPMHELWSKPAREVLAELELGREER